MLVGLRFWLLYIWFAFAISASMTEHDYRYAIRVVLVALLLMSPLVVAQHFSPPGAFINTEVDSNEDEIFLVAVGVVRTRAPSVSRSVSPPSWHFARLW